MAALRDRLTGRLGVVGAALCVAVLLCAAPVAGAHTRRVRHSPTKSVCLERIHRVKRRGGIRRIHVRTCARLAMFIRVTVPHPSPSGSFTGVPVSTKRPPVGDDEPPAAIKHGPLIPYGRKPKQLTIGGLPTAAAHAAAGGVSLGSRFDLAAGPFGLDAAFNVLAASGLQLAQMSQSSETSVAYAPNNVVLYTANGGSSGASSSFGAAYSANGGHTFNRLYATAVAPTTSIFPYPTYTQNPGTFGCAAICDQVVTYDKYNNMFIWVIQYPQNAKAAGNPDFERVAWTSPQNLVKYGSRAWSYTDLQSSTFSSTIALDQPRLGVTPGWLYISFNNPKALIVRIAHNAFKDLTFTRSSLGLLTPHAAKLPAAAVQTVNSSSCNGCSLRVARTTDGLNPGGSWREYFGGIGTTTSSVDIASVADDSNVLLAENVPTWGMAITNGSNAADWASLVPSGGNWMARTAGTIASPTVTESHGTVFVAWNEGRTVYNSKQQPTDINGNPLTGLTSTYSEPHIGVAAFIDNSSFSRISTTLGTVVIEIPEYSLSYSNELVNQNHALAMPELATAADGEVAMGFYVGGGPSYVSTTGSIYVAHAVGFLCCRAGDPVFTTDATSTSFTTDVSNVYGDYNTIAPLYGSSNCLVSSAVVTQTTSQNNQPVLTLFGKQGGLCPVVRQPTPNPIRVATQLTVTCPASVAVGAVGTVTGQLTPSPGSGTAVTVNVLGGAGAGTQTVSTSASGSFTATLRPGSTGTYSVGVSYGGSLIYTGSSANCSTKVLPLGSAISINCPSSAAVGTTQTLTATLLTPPLTGAAVQWTATAPDGTAATESDPTDATATSYFQLTGSQAGTWSIIAVWAGDATHAESTGSCQIAVQRPSTLTVTCPSAQLRPGTVASIAGTLTPAVTGSAVALSYAPPPGSGGTAGTDPVSTDVAGSYADTYNEDAAGTWTVTAGFAGDSTRAPAQASCTFRVL